MDDLVKRLRAAAIMSEALSIFLPHSEGSATAKLYNEAADAIEKFEHQVFLADLACKSEAAKAPRWIPVTERLPLYGQDVLAVRTYGDGEKCQEVLMAHIAVWDERTGEKWWNATNITHWMPLPQPPKEE